METQKKFTVRYLDWLGSKIVSKMSDEEKEYYKDLMWEIEPSEKPLGKLRIREFFLNK